MPKRVLDVLQSQCTTEQVAICIYNTCDELRGIYRLVRVLENACLSSDIPDELQVNADLAAIIRDELEAVTKCLDSLQGSLREMP